MNAVSRAKIWLCSSQKIFTSLSRRQFKLNIREEGEIRFWEDLIHKGNLFVGDYKMISFYILKSFILYGIKCNSELTIIP